MVKEGFASLTGLRELLRYLQHSLQMTCLEQGRVIYMALRMFGSVSWFSRLSVPFEMVNILL